MNIWFYVKANECFISNHESLFAKVNKLSSNYLREKPNQEEISRNLFLIKVCTTFLWSGYTIIINTNMAICCRNWKKSCVSHEGISWIDVTFRCWPFCVSVRMPCIFVNVMETMCIICIVKCCLGSSGATKSRGPIDIMCSTQKTQYTLRRKQQR